MISRLTSSRFAVFGFQIAIVGCLVACGHPHDPPRAGEGSLQVIVRSAGPVNQKCPFTVEAISVQRGMSLYLDLDSADDCQFSLNRFSYGSYELVARRVYDDHAEIGVIQGASFGESEDGVPFVIQATPAAELRFVYSGPRPANVYLVLTHNGGQIYRGEPHIEVDGPRQSVIDHGVELIEVPAGKILVEVFDLESWSILGSQVCEATLEGANTVTWVHSQGFED